MNDQVMICPKCGPVYQFIYTAPLCCGKCGERVLPADVIYKKKDKP